MSFLDGDGANRKVRELIGTASSARLAVAFWGAGAISRLGLDRAGLNLTVICNLESGACNPAEIRRLLKLGPSVSVLSDPRLHAKVYWTPSGAVVGSSNASTNGLASEADGENGWAEANVLVQQREQLASIEKWFDDRLPHARAISAEDLEHAEHLWEHRRKSAPPGIPFTGDLLEAYRSTPGHPSWEKVRLAIWTGDLDADAQREAETAVAEGVAPEDWEVYQDWKEDLGAGDWLIDFDLSKPKPRYTGLWRVGDPKVETSRVTFVARHERLTIPGFPPLSLHEEDRGRLGALTPGLLGAHGEDGGALIPLSVVVATLDGDTGRAPPIDVDGFRAVLLNTCREAKAVGYNPTGFLQMINRDPVGAVRQLLQAPRPSSGFAELLLRGRPDLTVEDIALRPEWRGLFTSAELRTARLRIGRKS